MSALDATTGVPADGHPELENPIAVRPAVEDVDLTKYRALGKIPWETRYERLIAEIPSVQEPRWRSRLQNLELLGRIVRDILKLEQAPPGRPGPRPALNVEVAEERLQQFRGMDYTLKPFHEAIRDLIGKTSARGFGNRTGLGRNRIQRLLAGDEPTAYDLRIIAETCGKHPSYFLEWRRLYILGAIFRRLEWAPETTIALFEKLDNQARKS